MISIIFCIAVVDTIKSSEIARSNLSLRHEQMNLDIVPSLTKQGLRIPWGTIGGSIALYTGWKAIQYGWQRYWRCPDFKWSEPVQKSAPVVSSTEKKEAIRKSNEQKYKEDYIAATNAFLRQENWRKLAIHNADQPKVAIDAAGTQFIDLNDKMAQCPESYLYASSYVDGMKAKIEQFSNDNREAVRHTPKSGFKRSIYRTGVYSILYHQDDWYTSTKGPL
jgi:hypothetical protein